MTLRLAAKTVWASSIKLKKDFGLWLFMFISSEKHLLNDVFCNFFAGDQFWSQPDSARAGTRPPEGPPESFRELCSVSRELWEGCRRLWKSSGRKILILHWFLMGLGCQKSPGTSFEAGRTQRARAPGRWRVLQRAFGRLQEAHWRFQRALGRLQKVLEGFLV